MPAIEWSSAIDVGFLLAGALLKFAVLLLLCRLLGRGALDPKVSRVFLISLLISVLYGFARSEYGSLLGPFMPLVVFALALLLLMGVCGASIWAALRISVLFAPICFAIDFGSSAVVERLAPDRKRISAVHSDMVDQVDAASANTNRPSSMPDLKKIAARALEGIAFFTSPAEREAMERDIQRGMELYRERKAMIESGELKPEPVTHGEVMAMVTGLSSTNDPEEIRRHVKFALKEMERLEKENASNSPPPEISESLRAIVANLSDTNAAVSLAALLDTASGAGGTLIRDTGGFEAAVDRRDSPVDRVVDGLSSSTSGLQGATAGLRQSGIQAAGLANVADGDIVIPVGGLQADTSVARLSVVNPEYTLEGEAVPMAPSDVAWGRARSSLRISGLMTVNRRDHMAIVNGDLHYNGDIIQTDQNGTSYWWRFVAISNDILQLHRLGATVR